MRIERNDLMIENLKTIKLTIDGEKAEIEAGVKLLDIAKDYQAKHKYPIILAKVGNQYHELNDQINDDLPIEFLDYKNRREDLRRDLAKWLECDEIIIIPSLNKTVDFTGHADGMMRFVNRDKVLVIKYDDKYKKDWWKNTQRILETNNISYVEVPFFEDESDPENPESAIGVYVNYLEVNDLIVLPVFGREEVDQQVINILKEQFPNKIIETINYNDIAKKGGLLNCTTWVMRK